MVIFGWILLALALASGGGTDEQSWQPAGLHPTDATIAVLPDPPAGRRSERIITTVGGRSAETRVEMNGRDVRFRTTIDGAAFESGTSGGVGWRRTPWGLTHLTLSDILGDPLDRWPRAIYGYDPADCRVVGQTTGDRPLVVVRDAPARSVPHWFFIDPMSRTIVREIQREGVSVASFTFDPDGRGWRVSGGGPEATVVRTPTGPGDPLLSFAPPASRPGEAFSTPEHRATDLSFRSPSDGGIELGGTVAGRRASFLLDDGTAYIAVSGDFANAIGLHPFLDHAIVPDMSIGGVRMTDVPVQVIRDMHAPDVLLGYDFFVGHIVHVDFRHQRVQVLPRSGWSAPVEAVRVPMDTSEGIPLISASFGDHTGSRFAIDLGSARALVTRSFAGTNATGIGFRSWVSPVRSYGFLEGDLRVRTAEIGEITFAGYHFRAGNQVLVEQPAAENLPIPLDGILGTDVIGKFALWFDDDGGALYVAPPSVTD